MAIQTKNAETRANVRLVQLTDTHLYENTSDVLVGMNCDEGMRDVISLIQREEGPLAAVLCTGDISQDNSAASYRRFAEAVSTLAAPQYWIAGNHDEVPKMKAAIGENSPCFTRAFSVPGWRVILLNSNVAGAVHGYLAADELAFLEQELAASRNESALVCLHHNCVPVAAAWLQKHALQNSDELFAVLDRHSHVKAVLFGHIHHELVHERRQVLYLGSPSTCIQFHPDSADFRLDTCNPGYRWLELAHDGVLRTGVKRVANKTYQVDFSGIGY
ncbi:MAG TPA: 3',5'-cyclic-AMP phosphodiesterase [Pseudomonadales bacterium]